MTVKLKHLGFVEGSTALDDPYNRTLQVVWEVDGDIPWSDPSIQYDQIIHTIKPVKLNVVHTPMYERID